MRPRLLAIAALLLGGLTAQAQATGGLSCAADDVSLDLTLGHTAVASVVGAYLSIGDESWSTSPEAVPGVPIAIGQAYGDGTQLLIDITDDIVNEVLAKLRLSIADHDGRQVVGGTLEVPGHGAWVVECFES